MTRTGQAAIDYARSRVGPNAMPASGYCLQFVRQCFDVPSYYASAIDAWNGSPTKHPGDRNPPPAVPLFFTSPSVYDHVVFGGASGEIITTFNADVRRYTASSTSAAIDMIVRDFGPGQYLGWTEDINRVRVLDVVPPPGPDPITEDDDDMPIIVFNGNKGNALLAGGRLVPLSDQTTIAGLNAAGIATATFSDADWDRLAIWSTAPLMIVEPSRGYALMTGGHAIGIGDMATVYALRGAGVTEVAVAAQDFDRFVAGIAGAVPPS